MFFFATLLGVGKFGVNEKLCAKDGKQIKKPISEHWGVSIPGLMVPCAVGGIYIDSVDVFTAVCCSHHPLVSNNGATAFEPL